MNILNPKRERYITVRDQKWRVKIPLPKEEVMIDVAISQIFRGQPLASIPQSTYDFTLATVTLNQVVIDKPSEFEDLKDFGDLYDGELITELWRAYQEDKEAFYQELKKNNGSGRADRSPDVDRPVPATPVQPAPMEEQRGPIPGAERVYPDGGRSDGPERNPAPSGPYPASENIRRIGPDGGDVRGYPQSPGSGGH